MSDRDCPLSTSPFINSKPAIIIFSFLTLLGSLLFWSPNAHATSCPALESRLQALEALTSQMQLVQIDGHWAYVFGLPNQGVNVYIQNGSGNTVDEDDMGLGNLIIGYNEPRGAGANARTGSHNLIVGTNQNYTSYGGAVFGEYNSITAPFSTVLGGYQNIASGDVSSVVGGAQNEASELHATVVGGTRNTASGMASVALAGMGNEAIAGKIGRAHV